MQYEHLFSPIKIGSKTAKNRIVFPCHSFETLPFPEYVAYQAARARGGCESRISTGRAGARGARPAR